MRLPMDDESSDCIATKEGADNLLRAIHASLGTQTVNDVGEKTDKYFYGGASRGPMARRPGQTMS